MKPKVSVVVPVFNEENRITNLKKIDKFLSKQKYSSELIVVNDGSTDRTITIIQGLVLKTKPKIISYAKNRGKGYAIRQGMLKATGKYRLFLDIDLSTPIEEIDNLIKGAKAEVDVVIGSRKIQGAKLMKRQPLLRETLGKGFTLLSRLILGIKVSDFTCGFKLFSEESSKKIFRNVKINRWGFDSEILFIAKKLGFSIKEIPVSWKDNEQTKVKLPQDIFRSLRDLTLIRSYSALGKYKKEKTKQAASISLTGFVVPILLIVLIALIVLSPSISLAHSGDDWLAFYRYKYHLGEWSSGQFNHLTYFLTPYGAQDITMGLLRKVFGIDAPHFYYLTSFLFRLLASFAIFFVVKFFSKSFLSGTIASLFFATTLIGVGATDWVFNMPSFLSIGLAILTFYFLLRAQREEIFKFTLFAAIFYYLSFIVAPIRMHGLPLILIAADLFFLIQKRNDILPALKGGVSPLKENVLSSSIHLRNKLRSFLEVSNKQVLKEVIIRQAIFVFVFFFIRMTGQSMGTTEDKIEKLTSGLAFISDSVGRGDFTFLLNPFVIVGRFFLPEEVWEKALKVPTDFSFIRAVLVPTLVSTPFIVFLKEIEKEVNAKKPLYPLLIIGLIGWILLLQSAWNKGFPFIEPAILGGFFLMFGLFVTIKTLKKPASNFFFISFAWVFLSFAFPWFWTPNATFGTTHRYLIISASGMALFWGTLISLSKKTRLKMLTTTVALVFIAIHSTLTNNFFSKLEEVRNAKIFNKIWSNLPNIREINIDPPIVIYFEGDSTKIYHNLSFGFPANVAVIFDMQDANKLPVPISAWNDLVKVTTTGENLAAYGYEPKPVATENVYAFELTKEGTMNDITIQTRTRLKKLIANEKSN